MSQRKVHHYNARSYLTRFVNENGVLWQYERGGEAPVPVSPKKAARESYLYSPEVGAEPKDDSFEVFLAEHVDTPAVQPLEKLISGADELTIEERFVISFYIAYQEFRVPERRDWVLGIHEEVARRILDLETAHPESFRKKLIRATGREYSEEEVASIINRHRAGGFRLRASKTNWLRTMIENCPKVAQIIFRVGWLVVEVAADVPFEFVTSDTPVTKILTDKSVPRWFAGGWLSPSAETTLTLTPKHVLVISREVTPGRLYISCDDFPKVKSWLHAINQSTVHQARRFVFARNRQEYINGVLARTDGWRD